MFGNLEWYVVPSVLAIVYALYFLGRIKERLDVIADILVEVHSGTGTSKYVREQAHMKWWQRDRW